LIHSRNSRKTQNSCNPEPTNRFIIQRDHHGWKEKEPYLEKSLQGKSWPVFFLSKPKIMELPQPPEPNATMARVTRIEGGLE
jgi:hypothetical protein